MLLDAIREDLTFLSTSPTATGLIYHLRTPSPAEILALPLGAALIAEVSEDARLLAELRSLPEAERQRDLEQARRARREALGALTWEEAIAARARELPELQRLAWSLVRGATTPRGSAPLCLVLDGDDGWPAPPEVERVDVGALHVEHLSRIALTATLGAVGALRRAVSLPGLGGPVGGPSSGA